MKKNNQLSIIAIALICVIYSACFNTDSGDKFVGNWIPSDRAGKITKIKITKVGETAYNISPTVPNMVGETPSFMAVYEKGNLKGDDIGIVSFLNGKIFIQGKEYERIKE